MYIVFSKTAKPTRKQTRTITTTTATKRLLHSGAYACTQGSLHSRGLHSGGGGSTPLRPTVSSLHFGATNREAYSLEAYTLGAYTLGGACTIEA